MAPPGLGTAGVHTKSHGSWHQPPNSSVHPPRISGVCPWPMAIPTGYRNAMESLASGPTVFRPNHGTRQRVTFPHPGRVSTAARLSIKLMAPWFTSTQRLQARRGRLQHRWTVTEKTANVSCFFTRNTWETLRIQPAYMLKHNCITSRLGCYTDIIANILDWS